MKSDPALVAAILRRNLFSFIRGTFPIVAPGASFTPNWHLEAIAYALTQVLEGKTRRLIITVPPRSLKSISASVAFPAFILGHDPRRRIICVSFGIASDATVRCTRFRTPWQRQQHTRFENR